MDKRAESERTYARGPQVYERLKADIRTAIPNLKPGQRIVFREYVTGLSGNMGTFYFRKLHAEEPDIAAHLFPLRKPHGLSAGDAQDPLRAWAVATEIHIARYLGIILANSAEDAAARTDDKWFQRQRRTLAAAQRELNDLQQIIDDPDYRRVRARNV